MPRGDHDPVAVMEQIFGPEYYIVHFNRQPGVADAAFAANPERFFENIFRLFPVGVQFSESPTKKPSFNVSLMALLDLTDPSGEPLMSREEMDVFLTAFRQGRIHRADQLVSEHHPKLGDIRRPSTADRCALRDDLRLSRHRPEGGATFRTTFRTWRASRSTAATGSSRRSPTR